VQPRNWDAATAPEDPQALDYSQPPANGSTEATLDPTRAAAEASRMDIDEEVTYDDDDEAIESELSNGKGGNAEKKGLLAGLLTNLKTNVVGKEKLTPEDVAAAVAGMQKRLQERNVSAEVAEQVCSQTLLLASCTSLSCVTCLRSATSCSYCGQ
jgi:hypothetical protein